MSSYEIMAQEVHGKNINTKTLLATDYMNHFNEVIMLLEMVADMPELLDEAKLWQPKTYTQHFQDSTFTNKDLAIMAYEFVPPKYKKAFEYAVGEINRIVMATIEKMDSIKDDREQLSFLAKENFNILRTLIEATSSVINGVDIAQNQSSVDTIIGG